MIAASVGYSLEHAFGAGNESEGRRPSIAKYSRFADSHAKWRIVQHTGCDRVRQAFLDRGARGTGHRQEFAFE